MSLIFPGTKIPNRGGSNLPTISNYIVDEVEKQFSLLPDSGQTNRISYKRESFISKDSQGNDIDHYRSTNNHFQSLARHSSGEFLIMSGGDSLKNHSHLLVIKLESFIKRTRKGILAPIGSNMIIKDNWRKDKLHNLYFIENSSFWHAGGISFMGDVLTVTVESKKNSKVVFLDFTDPIDPKHIGEINRNAPGRKTLKAGCATTMKLSNNHFFVAIWTDSDDFGRRFEFYISDQPLSLNGTFTKCGEILNDQIGGIGNTYPLLQSMQFIQDKSNNVFLIGADNSSRLINKRNRVFLFQLDFDPDQLVQHKSINFNGQSLLYITLRAHRILQDGGSWYNFGAAPGFYVDSEQLMIYCAYTWRKKSPYSLKMCEFSPRINPMSANINTLKEIKIELYREKNFTGGIFSLRGDNYLQIPDFNEVKLATHGDLKNRTKSIRLQLPNSKKVVFYEKPIFNQNNPNTNSLSITGNGKVISIHDLSDHILLNNIPQVHLAKQKSICDKIQSMEIFI